jgi:hypothetical protein
MTGPNPTPCTGGFGGGDDEKGDGHGFWSDPRAQALLIVIGGLIVVCAAICFACFAMR